MRLSWIAEILQRMWIILFVVIMAALDFHAECFLFKGHKARSLTSHRPRGQRHDGQSHFESTRADQPEVLFEPSIAWAHPRVRPHSNESVYAIESISKFLRIDNSPKFNGLLRRRIHRKTHLTPYAQKSAGRRFETPPSAGRRFERPPHLSPKSTIGLLREEFRHFPINRRRPTNHVTGASQNNGGHRHVVEKDGYFVEAHKRKEEKVQVSKQSPQDFNQKREYDEITSDLACPVEVGWVKLTHGQDLLNNWYLIEQPPEDGDQRDAQYFYEVKCAGPDTTPTPPPPIEGIDEAECPTCCRGIDTTRYDSQCQTTQIYVTAWVRVEDPSQPSGWGTEVILKNIRQDAGCSCRVSPKRDD